MSVTVAAPANLRRRRGLALRSDFIFGYGLVIAFVGLVAGLIVVHGGSLLEFGYPLIGTVLGFVLYLWRRGVYVAYVWWIWLFTPEVRRFVDFQTTYHTVSTVMVTPLTVTLISSLFIIKAPGALLNRKVLPFSIFGLVLVYGLCVGIFIAGPFAAFYDFANWLAPLCFGIYLLLDGERFNGNRDALVSASMIGLVGTAAYGLYQFYHFPPWDAFWLSNSDIHSGGVGVAEDVRLFGPLNSALPYGIALMVPLTLAFAIKGPVRIVGACIGFPAFGLSLVRFAWLGWLLAVTYLLARIGGRTRIRVVISGLVIAALAYPLVTVGPVASALSARLSTFNNIQQDGSFQARVSIYEGFAVECLSEPIGLGMGSASIASKLGGGTEQGIDSGILEIPLVFGWPGAALIFWAMSVVAMRVLPIAKSKTDKIGLAAGGIFLGMLLQPLGEVSFAGILGIVTWAFAAIAYRGKPQL